MTVMVTGGAGYIGSVIVDELVERGYQITVVDDLRQGHREVIPAEVEFYQADICNIQKLEEMFQSRKIEAVIHLAAESTVGFSMTDPARFFQTNVIGGLNLLNVMRKYRVNRFIFSSSAAVYGEPDTVPIEEGHSTNPVNAYGDTKLVFENILNWYSRAYGIKRISLRYFNAAGATAQRGEDHHPETHLIPIVLKAALDGKSTVPLFGTDYPTKDGSCVRDYVHVGDIAQAHILALRRLDTLNSRAYNLGNSGGYSVIEVIETAQQVTGLKIPVKVFPRRAGDPAALVASSKLAKDELGWQPEFPRLDDIIESAWKWLKDHPNGYET